MFENKVTRMVARLDEKLADLDDEARAKVEASATLDLSEWATLGDKPSRAYLDGLVDLDSANTLHAIHTDFNNGATLAQRMVFMMFAYEYLDKLVGQ